MRMITPQTASVLFTVSLTIAAATAHAAFRVDEATIAEIHAAMESGELTARGLVEVYLERIAAYDQGGPAINAVILVNPNAIARAEAVSGYELDAHLSAYLRASGMPVRSLSDVLASGKYEPMLEGLYQRALTRSVDEPEYQERRLARLTLRDHVMKLMADHRLDALVYPHQKRLVVPIGNDQVDRNGVLGAITGFPAITVPGGFSPKTSSAPLGVPIGVEFLGRPFSEPVLIRLASAFEHQTRHRRTPASTPPLAQHEP